MPSRFLGSDRSENGTCARAETAETCPGRGEDDCGCDYSCYCNRRIKLAMLAALDEAVRNVTDAIRSHPAAASSSGSEDAAGQRDVASSLWANTIVWFSSDNGGEPFDGGNNLPLRGGKFTYWEVSVSVEQCASHD